MDNCYFRQGVYLITIFYYLLADILLYIIEKKKQLPPAYEESQLLNIYASWELEGRCLILFKNKH